MELLLKTYRNMAKFSPSIQHKSIAQRSYPENLILLNLKILFDMHIPLRPTTE
jgi:hypothetical protein